MTIRSLPKIASSMLLAVAAGTMLPVTAGSGVPGSILPQPSISPGLSQNCVDALNPRLRGAAANRAARACRRPTGPSSPVRTAPAKAPESVTAPSPTS